MDFLTQAFSFDPELALVDLLRVTIAFALALPIGWDRERSRRNVGLRTFPIVSMTACGYMLILGPSTGQDAEASARLIQGLITGIGFIGGGAILKKGANVQGLATAASIWCTGAIGASVAFRRLEIAVVLSVINFLALWLISPVIHTDNGSKPDLPTLRQ